ncbi:transcription-repair coupling factor [Rubellicoccus peritrichatus]|uniref:Transcription-repair-coupling factor n=1 Tax=Rubellicoccus peritrichatus TaxID=3080537 RepID=A0AAQ3LB00_9BACT|nr:transcription-repair coupling factor [Puniceicoccus sp. CR14]WOO40942.1 transcription-repair coupling factor [Puniceicoccus sp. CR14]
MKPVALPKQVTSSRLTGVTKAASSAICSLLLRKKAESVILFVGKDLRRLEGFAADLETAWEVLEGADAPICHVFPDVSELDEDDPRAFEMNCDRLTALTELREVESKSSTKQLVIAVTPRSLLSSAPAPNQLASHEIILSTGDSVDFHALQERLATELGYDAEAVCETPGQFAVRGGLIDIYPLNGEAPARIDLFGEEIDEIRLFDPTTQRSREKIERLVIASNVSQQKTLKTTTLLDYLPKSIRWIVDEPSALEDAYNEHFNVPEKIAAPFATFATVIEKRKDSKDTWFGLSELDIPSRLFKESPSKAYDTESLEAYRTFAEEDKLGVVRFDSERESRTRFLQQLALWSRKGYQLSIITRNQGEQDRLADIIAEELDLEDFKPRLISGQIADGFRLDYKAGKNSRREVVVNADEIFGRHRIRVTKRRRKLPEHKAVDQALDFSELADGDHLVHLQNGVCIFRGLQKMDFGGKAEEVISLEFAEEITVHLRLHESHLLSRYVGLSKVTPKLGKIGTNQWEKTRAAAERATLDFAAELLRLQAERETAQGHAFAPDSPWLKNFEDAFPFQETRDQKTAIDETKLDMEQPNPMDRLICGDVGFGKTEVAIRAAFKAVLDGKQVAMLIPTTVLCQQHFNTFRERFVEHPVVVEMLSRFRTPKQQKEIKLQMKTGQIDIIVGTHSLLARGVEFQDLGLLIIDEEHRFGVKQKEKIKQLRRNIDVLTMSATPIPRTLHSALVGVRQMSVIETAPRNRLPIQTVVKSYDPTIVKDAVKFELNRGGQVFYLHNRVQTIETVAARIRELVPNARLAVGHGQMEEGDLEKIMTDFVAGRYDVLVCTTIIESGLDIPNCNTIIIEGADRFGLGQLYQLRGRVGRFNKQAYAYLLLHRHTKLMDLARKRLGAIRQYNQLGAGFRIAMRDLELRGAGNLLGAQQSGHIAGVGFDLYCQLLRQSVSRLKGDINAAAIRANVRLDFVILGESRDKKGSSGAGDTGYDAIKSAELGRERIKPIEAALPTAYLGEARLRIDFYRRLAMAGNLDEVEEISETLEDRFGKRPKEVDALLMLTRIRVLAERRGIVAVETEGNRLKCQIVGKRPAKYVQSGGRFPRLTARKPIPRLREIRDYLKRLPTTDK